MKKFVIICSLAALAVGFFYAPCVYYYIGSENKVVGYGRRPLWTFNSMTKIDSTPWVIQLAIPAAFLAYGLFGIKGSNKSE